MAFSGNGINYAPHAVQWSEDVIKADPFFGGSRVRFRVPPWVSITIARDHLAKHRMRPCELRAVVRGVSRWFTPLACGPGSPELSKSYMDMASKLFTFTFTFT